MTADRNSPLPQLVRNRKRFETILGTLAKYGLADRVRDWNPEYVKKLFRTDEGEQVADLAPAVRLRMALTELGTTFIKLGQSLSTRADLVGPETAATHRPDDDGLIGGLNFQGSKILLCSCREDSKEAGSRSRSGGVRVASVR